MRGPLDYVRGIQHPEAFHGRGVQKGFFEGWYVKLVSADVSQRWAVIPGIFKGLGGSSRNEAFVQVLNGATGESWYHTFPESEFSAATDKFDVTVGGNHFFGSGVTLHLPQLKGTISYESNLDPWPVTLREPGIMGWYGMVPFMECFHGIVSFGHSLAGELVVNGESASFDGGRGYIEKDWGKAFPAGYIWMHSNHFEPVSTPATTPSQSSKAPELNHTSIVGSVAIIPWLGSAFRGFIIGMKHQGHLLKWTTYNGSSEKLLSITDDSVHWQLTGPDGTIELTADRKRGGLLHAPMREAMHQRVDETLDSSIKVSYLPPAAGPASKLEAFEANARVAGLEVFGDTDRLIGLKKKTQA